MATLPPIKITARAWTYKQPGVCRCGAPTVRYKIKVYQARANGSLRQIGEMHNAGCVACQNKKGG